MKAKLLFGIILLFAGLLFMQQPAATQGVDRFAVARNNVDQEIRGLEQKVNAAYAANDLPAYFAYYAADCTQWLPEGRTDLEKYKKDWTAYVSAGNRVQATEISDLYVQISPSQDAAVASYLLHVKTKLADGQATEEDSQETDVWFKRDGVWRVVELHYSAVPKK
jgi:ketosteroid isomerase-like protein